MFVCFLLKWIFLSIFLSVFFLIAFIPVSYMMVYLTGFSLSSFVNYVASGGNLSCIHSEGVIHQYMDTYIDVLQRPPYSSWAYEGTPRWLHRPHARVRPCWISAWPPWHRAVRPPFPRLLLRAPRQGTCRSRLYIRQDRSSG